MNIFRRPPGVSADAIDAYQRASDPVLEAGDFIESRWQSLRFDQLHPWHADDLTLLRMGYAAIALSCDRTAEALRKSSIVKHGKTDKLSPDAADFALGLSQNAARLMNKGVTNVMATQSRVNFHDDKVAASLNPESQVPYWPRSADGTRLKPWQRIDTPVVTPGFLRGIIDATELIRVDADAALQYLTDEQRTAAAIPPEYASMAAVVGDITRKATNNLESADATLSRLGDDIPDGMRSEVYGQIHEGYIDSCAAFVAAVCPPMLGEEFIPER